MDLLSERQRDALWLRAQGLTAAAVGRRLDPPCTASGAQDLLHKVIVTLGAADTPNAIFKAITLGIIGPYRDCGSRASWLRHLNRNEQSCIACRRANTAYVRAQRVALAAQDPEAGNKRGRAKTPGLTARQIDVLKEVQLGVHSTAEISSLLSLSEPRVRYHIQGVLTRLGLTHTPGTREELLALAVVRGVELGYLTADPLRPRAHSV